MVNNLTCREGQAGGTCVEPQRPSEPPLTEAKPLIFITTTWEPEVKGQPAVVEPPQSPPLTQHVNVVTFSTVTPDWPAVKETWGKGNQRCCSYGFKNTQLLIKMSEPWNRRSRLKENGWFLAPSGRVQGTKPLCLLNETASFSAHLKLLFFALFQIRAGVHPHGTFSHRL